jgi:excisionase family DNA binding protein
MKPRKSVRDQNVEGVKKILRQHRDSLRQTFSVEQTATILGISRGAAYEHARSGVIPTIRLGKRLLVPKAALEKLLEAGAA